MTVATTFRILWPPQAGIDGTGADRLTSGSSDCPIPLIMYGLGTPAGTLAPWTTASVGSIWLSTNQTDNADCAWVKQYSNDAVADWVPLRGSSGGAQRFETQVFDLDAAANEYDYLFFPNGAEVVAAYLVYTEATDASGAAEAGISAGTAADGTQVMALQAIGASKAVGDATALTIADGTVASKLVTKNTVIEATEAGKYKVVYYVVQP